MVLGEIKLDGWYEVHIGTRVLPALHRVTDEGRDRLRTKCGVSLRAAYSKASFRMRCCKACAAAK
jgi:hypothetical protein